MLCHLSILRISSSEALWNIFSVKMVEYVILDMVVSSSQELTGEASPISQYQEDLCFAQAAGLVFIYKH